MRRPKADNHWIRSRWARLEKNGSNGSLQFLIRLGPRFGPRHVKKTYVTVPPIERCRGDGWWRHLENHMQQGPSLRPGHRIFSFEHTVVIWCWHCFQVETLSWWWGKKKNEKKWMIVYLTTSMSHIASGSFEWAMGLLKSKYSTCLCKYTFQIRFRRGVVNLRLRRWRHCQSTSNIDIPSSYGTCARFPPYKHQSVESVVLHVYTSVESFRTFIDRTAAENIFVRMCGNCVWKFSQTSRRVYCTYRWTFAIWLFERETSCFTSVLIILAALINRSSQACEQNTMQTLSLFPRLVMNQGCYMPCWARS